MKKSNEKGFLLAEAIVVGMFVLGLFTFLFVNIIPIVGVYEEYSTYDTLDGSYNTNLIRAMIMEDSNVSNILKLGTSSYKVYSPSDLCNLLSDTQYCSDLLGYSYLGVSKIYVTWYRTAQIKSAATSSNSDFDRATRDYIDYLEDFKQPTGTTYNKYHRIIVCYNDGTFANVEIKVSE